MPDSSGGQGYEDACMRSTARNSAASAGVSRLKLRFFEYNADGDFVAGDNYIDPEKWSSLIYNFRHYFRLAEKELGKTFRAER